MQAFSGFFIGDPSMRFTFAVLVLVLSSVAYAETVGNAAPIRKSENSGVGSRVIFSRELQLLGQGKFSGEGNTIRIQQQAVRNNRFSGVSSPITLELWEFKKPYAGDGTDEGFRVAFISIGTLSAGQTVSNVNQVSPYLAADDGTYFTTLLLVEGGLAYDAITFLGNDVYVNGVVDTVAPPELDSPTAAVGKQNAPFNFTFSGAGALPITYTATNLPPGLTLRNTVLDANTPIDQTPLITGIPTKAGIFVVTLKATNNDGSDTLDVPFDIKSKDVNAAPTIFFTDASPTLAFTGQRVSFFANAVDPENGNLTYTWNFGDGTSGNGPTVFHTFSSANTYNVVVSVSDGTTTVTGNVSVSVIGSTTLNPFIDAVSSDKNPALIGTVVTFTATGISPANQTLTYQWNFGDGSPIQSGNPITHTFTAAGGYNVLAAVQDTSARVGVFTDFVQFVADSSDPKQNILTGDASVSPDGISITVLPAPRGIVALGLDVTSSAGTVNRAAVEFTTEFSIPGRGAKANIPGRQPVQNIDRSGVVVATATGADPADPTNKMKGRKTIPVGAADLGQDPDAPDTLTASQKSMVAKKLTGKFNFVSDAADTVSFSCELMLPAGYDLTASHELSVGIANVADRIVLDSKGKPAELSDRGLIKKVSVKYPKSKTGATTAVSVAKLDVSIVAPNLDTAGFESDGVTPNAAANLNLQLAVVLAGIPYTGEIPATLKVSSKKDKAAMKLSK